MIDYKTPMNRNLFFEREEIRAGNQAAYVVAAVLVALLFVGYGLAGREDYKAEQDIEQTTKAVEQAGIVYSKPAAFRKASPTHEQMWAMDHLTNVSRVAHAERQQP